ncbi:MAG: histidine--tRNA ligase [Capsulimonadales bacterium]|nr:histidine--tRNA ligase [Capsulimonadales bacterium]
MRFSAPKGTHDLLPAGPDRTDWADDIDKWHWLENVFRELAVKFGYDEVRTPTFESTDLFKRAVGEGTDIVSKEMYEFTTKGGDEYTLRPEGTAPALRAFVQHRLYIERPVTKLYYISSIFRYERQQKGRYRQHHQVGVEVLGAAGPDVDAEIISLAMAFFRRLGVARLTLKVNSVGNVESRARYIQALRGYAEPFLSEMSEDNQRRFRENALRMLDSKDERDIRILSTAPKLSAFLSHEDRAHFDKLCQYLETLGVSYEHDELLVRGFDYYTRTTFEVVSPDVGAQSALAGGGRYDRLVEEIGGPPTPGIGFGLGIERALIALQAAGVKVPEPPAPRVMLCPIGQAARDACVGLLATIRRSGIAADMDYTGRKLKTMLEQADRVKAHYVVIIGDEELAQGVVQLRNQLTAEKEQRAVPLKDLSYFLTH